MNRILVVDDHVLLRKGLMDYLKTLSGFEVVAEASDYETAMNELKSKNPGIVILDISLPGKNGSVRSFV